jgi:hypothetical protein
MEVVGLRVGEGRVSMVAGVNAGSKDSTSSADSEQGSFTNQNMNRQVANSLAYGVSIMKKRPNHITGIKRVSVKLTEKLTREYFLTELTIRNVIVDSQIPSIHPGLKSSNIQMPLSQLRLNRGGIILIVLGEGKNG